MHVIGMPGRWRALHAVIRTRKGKVAEVQLLLERERSLNALAQCPAHGPPCRTPGGNGLCAAHFLVGAHTYQSRLGKGAHSTYRASSSGGSRGLRRAHTLVDYSTHPRYSPGQGGGPPDPAD